MHSLKLGVFCACDAVDKWNWTGTGSLQYNEEMCAKPETGGSYPDNDVILVINSTCNKSENSLKFLPSKYRSLQIHTTGHFK